MQRFQGRVAVITGGASGIGLGIARRLAREGMNIVIANVEEPAMNTAVAELRSAGARVAGIRCDVADKAQVEDLADSAFDTFGAVHVLCNNAGVASPLAPSWAQSDGDWECCAPGEPVGSDLRRPRVSAPHVERE